MTLNIHQASQPLSEFKIPRGQSSILDAPCRVHLIGIGGAGVSGAARILLDSGHKITGYDREPSPFSQPLESVGVRVRYGASQVSALPPDAQLVIRSAAIPDNDPQLVAARDRGLPVLKYADFLAYLSQRYRVLAVAGTHGKTTTSWMLHHALTGVPGMEEAGALVGGTHSEKRVNAIAPKLDSALVVEACEYDRTFLRLAPRGAIITNVEADHLDYYGNLKAIHEAFSRFAAQVAKQGLLVLGSNVPQIVAESAQCETWQLGKELRTKIISRHGGKYTFSLKGPGWHLPKVQLAVPGKYNVENAALAVALAIGRGQRWDLEPEAIGADVCQSLFGFTGVARRFESWGTAGGVEIVHDYAHHPTEVRATLDTARRTMPGKPIHVLFQPHQHSRTARFLDEFAASFAGANRVVVANVYGARNHIDSQSAGAQELVDRLNEQGIQAELGGSPVPAARALAAGLEGVSGALILGAGDIDGIKQELRSSLALRCT